MQTQDQAAQRVATAQKAIAEAAANGSQASARQINSFVSSLTRAASTAGLTRSQLLELQAAQLGVSDAAASSIAKLRAVEEASKSNGEAMHSFSLNSVAARRELAVLGHEAATGSWKNFGGSLLVLAERTDALSLVFSGAGVAIGAVAGVIGGFIYEVVKGASSMSDLAHASQITNGYLGLTYDQLNAMSKAIAGTGSQITTVQAAMTALVSSGQIAADQLALATKVTAEFAEDTGVSAEKAAEAMIHFAKDPQKALEDLQGQYHTFSASQVDVIENYIKTGDSAAAYKAILQGMAQAHQQFKEHAQENIGAVGRAWGGLKSIVIETINYISQIGVATSNAEQLTAAIERQAKAQRNLMQAQSMPFGNTMSAQQELDAANAQVTALQKVGAAQKAVADEQAKRAAGGDAVLSARKYLSSSEYASPLQQRNLAIQKENAKFDELKKNRDALGKDFEDVEKRHVDNLAEIEKQYQSRNGSKSAASAAATAAQQAIKAQLDALDADKKRINDALKSSLSDIASQRQQGLITAQQQLDAEHAARQAAYQQLLIDDEKQLQVAKGEKNKQAYKKYADDIAAVRQSMAEDDKKYTNDTATLATKRAADLKIYTDALAQQLETQRSAAANTLSGLSMGSDARADFDKQLAIRQDYDRKVADLAKQRTENKIDFDQYADELAATKEYYDQSIEIAQKSSNDIRAANAQWFTGAKRAVADYADAAANVAAGTASAFQDAFRGMEDAFAAFVTTGKLNFSSLATSVIADIARMQARAAISGLFNFAMSAVSSYFTPSTTTGNNVYGFSTTSDTASTFHLADGGRVAGPGTSNSDSIAAWLSDGEYVLRADAVKRIGVNVLDAVNQGRHVSNAARFASGGYVGASANAARAGGGDINIDAPVTVQGGADSAANQSGAADLQKKIRAAVREVVVNERRQGGALWKMQNGVA
ncbi:MULTISPECIES: phage tail tape measure protein [unclassified Caballeronia]|uniref:phage tail tape measure protein n=1 Tax=unclassified Caballeronia TaxID=2646786 RepID=UPI002866D7D5|nr:MULTISPECIES: phage tail tape measure protein [unclassified Caballeronia]MDR5774913.1 phage tail tape measure protein [Caballeronia sp. LZ002]MDR5850349.1 phage tail tape measure protein [Caballeronia sp. LZ003]